MVLRQFIKGGIDHFHIRTFDSLLDIRYFLGALVDQQNDQMHFRIVLFDGFCHFFQQRGLTCFRRRYDHTSLPLAHRAHQIHDAHSNGRTSGLKLQSLFWENRS